MAPFFFALILLLSPVHREEGKVDVWPFTEEQFQMLLSDAFEHSFDPQIRKKMQIETWEQMHDFIYALIESDYTKIVQNTVANAGFFHKIAYQLLGLHGTIEDAEDLYRLVQNLSFMKGTPIDYESAKFGMIRGLGFFLMRDHYFPQENRVLMQEIEDYLFYCSDWATPSCWPVDLGITEEEYGRPFREMERQPYRMRADEAISYGLSQKAIDRCQHWLETGTFFDMKYQAKLCLSNMEETRKLAEKIMPYLKPVLSYKEMMKTSGADGSGVIEQNSKMKPRRPLPNVLNRVPPLRIDLPFNFGKAPSQPKP